MSDMTPTEAADHLDRIIGREHLAPAIGVLFDHARATAAPEIAERSVEIVTGEQAAKLPNGSLVCPWRHNRPDRIGGVAAHEIGTLGDALMMVLASRPKVAVLYRAPEPVAPPAVGDDVPNHDAAKALPLGTLLASRGARGFVTLNDSDEPHVDWAAPVGSITNRWPARIIDLPGGDS